MNKVYLALHYNDRSLLSTLTKIFTGSRTYHVSFATNKYIYEMNLVGVIRKPLKPSKHTIITLYEMPIEIPESYLIEQVLTRPHYYGIIDYLLFGVRALGIRLSYDGKGVICSEWVNEVMIDHGWASPWHPDLPPPSPADIQWWISWHDEFREVRRINGIHEENTNPTGGDDY